ncbi:MAG TPA: hypothetical protein VJ246_03430, partial [Patescibacteria group bacterium]|nr:hypothetical protein [Patescibacteria group bacterium]
STPTPKPKLSIPANQIQVSERPFVSLEPTAAREVLMTIGDLRKKADSVDFELQYSSGEKEEAAIGSLELSKGSAPYRKTILLGSKSGGGKITYHELVTGGTLVLTFYDLNYKLSNEWAYIDNKKPQTSFSSRDAKFQIETGKLFKGSAYIIIYNNPGLPDAVGKPILAGPYSITGTTDVPNGDVKLTIRMSEEKPAVILGWNGKQWKSYPAKIDGKTATATVEYASTYVVVEK